MTLNERRQVQNATYCRIPCIRNVHSRKIQRQEVNLWLPGAGNGRVGVLLGTWFLSGVMKMLSNPRVVHTLKGSILRSMDPNEVFFKKVISCFLKKQFKRTNTCFKLQYGCTGSFEHSRRIRQLRAAGHSHTLLLQHGI